MAKGKSSTTPSDRFFEELGRRGYEPLLGSARGTVRLDLVDDRRTERWFLTLDRGDVSVSHRNAAADCVVRVDRRLFDALVNGEANAMAAYLRGAIEADGNAELLLVLDRVLSAAAPRSRRRRRRARTERR